MESIQSIAAESKPASLEATGSNQKNRENPIGAEAIPDMATQGNGCLHNVDVQQVKDEHPTAEQWLDKLWDGYKEIRYFDHKAFELDTENAEKTARAWLGERKLDVALCSQIVDLLLKKVKEKGTDPEFLKVFMREEPDKASDGVLRLQDRANKMERKLLSIERAHHGLAAIIVCSLLTLLIAFLGSMACEENR